MIKFLTKLYSLGLSYSAIGTARAAINAFTMLCGPVDLSGNALLRKFIKGVFNKRPSIAKQPKVWDVNIVLTFICQCTDNSLMFLTCKLCLLFLLLSAQRCQTLHLIELDDLQFSQDKLTISTNHLLKQSRPNYHQENITFERFSRNDKLCIVKTFEQYLDKTVELRYENDRKLLISTQSPHRGVARSTVARWVKRLLIQAGIDPSFTCHSTRAASTSFARKKGIPIETIQKSAGWSNARTFHTFYFKPIIQNDSTCTSFQSVIQNAV